MLRGFRLGPNLERPHFGEFRSELDRHQTLARFAESQYGVKRSVQMELALVLRRKRHHITCAVLSTGARAVQPERDRFVRDQLQIPGVELDGGTFLGAAGR